jgi:hypothetical protein
MWRSAANERSTLASFDALRPPSAHRCLAAFPAVSAIPTTSIMEHFEAVLQQFPAIVTDLKK